MPATLNPHVLPPNGFYFVDSDEVRFTAPTLAKLVTAITEYRAMNNIAAGDPRQEVVDFTCARYPSGCRSNAKPLKAVAEHLPLVSRVTRWLTIIIRGMSKQPGSYVSKLEANRRAAICLQCPHQANWLNQCPGCAAGMRRLSSSVRRGMEADGGEKLLGCGVLGEDTRTSVFLDKLAPSARPELPDFCWRKAKTA